MAYRDDDNAIVVTVERLPTSVIKDRIKSNLGMAEATAEEIFSNRHQTGFKVTKHQLIERAHLALAEAVETYKPYLQATFDNYASTNVRRALLELAVENTHPNRNSATDLTSPQYAESIPN